MPRFLPAFLLLGVIALPAMAQQPLTLAQALARSDSAAFGVRAARAGSEAEAARRQSTLKGILPSFRLEGGWMRTTDPLNAFGFSLRQRAVTQASFDPDALNYPAPISNVGAGVVLEVPLINADAWLGRAAATRAMEAAGEQERWTTISTRLDVTRAYYGGVLAGSQVGALEAALEAARGHVRSAESMLEQGMVTRSDVLLARVRLGQIETRLLEARGQARLATRQLATALGTPGDTALRLPTRLPEPDAVRALPGTDSVGTERADLAAARLGSEAAHKDVSRTSSVFLPRINSFARSDWNDPTTPFGGQSAWTVGVFASWSVFGGGGQLAARREASARAAAADAMLEAVQASAGLDRAQRAIDLEVARDALAIAEESVAQSVEAHRIVARKYDGGLATVTELLEAAAVETETRLALSAAVHRVIVAAAGLQLAQGMDLSALTVLDQGVTP